MRVLIASDSFGGTLSAQDACEAMAEGWRIGAPRDQVVLLPLSDGGPGFISAIANQPTAKIWNVLVRSPLGALVEALIAQVGQTAYIESAQACGRYSPADMNSRSVREGTTLGVGDLVAHALVLDGVKRIVIGLGGSSTNDAGAGALAALGAGPFDALCHGGVGLLDIASVDLGGVKDQFADIELLIATDVDNPLLGPQGASEVYARQKGASVADVIELEAALTHFADITDPSKAGTAGSGAAGGLGFGLMLVGARRVSGIEMVAEALDLEGAIALADLVITGEGSFDWQSLRGKVIAGVSRFAAKQGKPVVVLAGQVHVARREFMALGVESAYAVAESAVEIEASLANPRVALVRRAESVARTWSPGH
jgi:glycerate kinase